MKDFARLLDRLVYTPATSGKLALLAGYFRDTPDPERGYGLAALSGGLPVSFPLRRSLAELARRRFDPELFRLSRDYVGDTAETVALIWEVPGTVSPQPLRLSEIVAALANAAPLEKARLLESWLDALDVAERWALLKFLSGAPRAGVSARLARLALAQAFGTQVEAIEEIWHGLEPPYLPLFAWLDGRGPKPDLQSAPVFRPLMLAHPLADDDFAGLDPADFAVEWKWDGIRVQIAGRGGTVKLFSRSGDDIGEAFPDLLDNWRFDAVLDGELLVMRQGEVAPFQDLQQRLNRKSASRAMLRDYPAHVRLYDVIEIAGEDIRGLPLAERRIRLEAWHAAERPPATDVSERLSPPDRDALVALWETTRASGIEGLMLKRLASPYLAGRPRGHWYKWKRAALTADCVLMYAQRGAGKRSSLYSDYTLGVWRDTPEGPGLVPVGKAYSGYTDAELARLDRFVRDNTVERFGPVCAVSPSLVFEVAFDAVQRSSRHKAGLAMRFPRIARIRWDKPAAEADTLDALQRLMQQTNMETTWPGRRARP